MSILATILKKKANQHKAASAAILFLLNKFYAYET